MWLVFLVFDAAASDYALISLTIVVGSGRCMRLMDLVVDGN